MRKKTCNYTCGYDLNYKNPKGCCKCKYCLYNQCYSSSCFSKSINMFTKWESVPYAGQVALPVAVPPDNGICPLCFLTVNDKNQFFNLLGQLVNTNIKNPRKYYDLKSEFEFLSKVQCNLTCKDMQIAKYWASPPSFNTFVDIANKLILAYNVPYKYAYTILSYVYGVLNDISIVIDYLKFYWDIIRPCQYNQCFKTAVCTPLGPAYPSGHSATSACMAELLSYFFPAQREKLFEVALQSNNSRYLSGVHFKMDCEEGMKLGVNVANSIIEYIKVHSTGSGSCENLPYTQYIDVDITPNYFGIYYPPDTKCQSLLLDTSTCQ